MRAIGSAVNGDYDLAAGAAIYSATPDASTPRWVSFHIEVGDGAKDLDGAGGDFELRVLIGSHVFDGASQTKTVEAAEETICFQTVPVLVPANKAVTITLTSPNAADTDVDVTVQPYDVAPLQPATAGRTLDVAAGGEAGIDLDNAVGALGTSQFDPSFLTASLTHSDFLTELRSYLFGSDNPLAMGTDGVVSADAIEISGSPTAADNAERVFDTEFTSIYNDSALCWRADLIRWDGVAPNGLTLAGNVPADVASISSDTTAADNLEKAYDGSGYGALLIQTTIASVITEAQFTLTDGSPDDQAYLQCLVVFEDQTTPHQKKVALCSDWIAGTKRLYVAALGGSPSYVIAAGDRVTILACRAVKPAAVDGSAAGFINFNGSYVQSDVQSWLNETPNALQSGRVDSYIGAMGDNTLTSSATHSNYLTELRSYLFGSDNALNMDVGGNVGLQDGTSANQIDLTSGHVTLADGSLVTAKLGTFVLAKTTNITGFNDLSAAQVNTEVDSALADVRLDELLAADSDIDGAAPPTVGSVFHELMSKTAGSFTFDQATDSLEALRDRGDAAWITATGFSTHSAADVWTAGTRTLTALGFDLSSGDFAAGAVDANALATDAVNEIRNAITGGAYALDTDANGRIRVVDGTGAGELDTTAGLVKISGTLQTLDALDAAQDAEHDATQAAIAALNNLSAAAVLSQIETALGTTTRSIPGQVAPPASPTILEMLGVGYKWNVHPQDQNATHRRLYNRAGTVVDQKQTAGDDDTTASLGLLSVGP